MEETFLDVWKSVNLFNLGAKIYFPANCMSYMRADHGIISFLEIIEKLLFFLF